MNERIKKVSSIFYYQILNESKNKKTLKNRVFLRHFINSQKSLKLLYKKVFEKIFFWILKISKKQQKLMIFQMNIHPAMSDYYRSHTECYKVVEKRKVLCTLIMQTTSWVISTIYNQRPHAKNQPSSSKSLDLADIWISPIIWSQLTFGRFNSSQQRKIGETQ